jgi:mannose-1-phosphate guanylyltransferase
MIQTTQESDMIHPVILCGGSGTRLWPFSRKQAPKPFLPMLGDHTLFQRALLRVADSAVFAAPMIVASAEHVSLIEAQVPAGAGYSLVIEPAARNTAPAIALAAALLPDDAIMLVCPSDHHIADEAAFGAAVAAAASLAAQDYLVSFGITPGYPETGYGYLQRGAALAGGYAIRRFVEKPDRATAEAYLASGEYSWNGGIFAFRAGYLLEELARHRPAMAEAVRAAAAQGTADGTRFHPAPAPFMQIAAESIDYAVMENTTRAAMVPVEMGWSDIGNFAALHDALAAMPESAADGGNVSAGIGAAADFVDCRNVMVMSDGPRVSAVGLEDVCVIIAGGEVLVTTRDGAQLVGKLPGAINQ